MATLLPWQLAVVAAIAALLPAAAHGDAPLDSDAPAPTLELPASSPGHARESLLKAGWSAYQRGDFPAALSSYRQALDMDARDASLWYDVGCLHALNSQLDAAQDALRRALALNPALPEAHDALGQASEQAGNTAAANAAYGEAVSLAPQNAKFLRHRIRTLLQLNEPEAARNALQDLLRIDPNDLDARCQLGILELRANAPDLAIHTFQTVVERDPARVIAWNGLGLGYARLGTFDLAQAALGKAAALEPDNPATQNNLGVVAAAQARWTEAREAWERTQHLDPDFAPAKRNLDLMEPSGSLPPQ